MYHHFSVRVLWSFLTVFNLIYYVHCKCDSFDNVEMEITPKHGKPFNVAVNGCIERVTFGNVTVKGVSVREKKVPHLKKDAIKHLVQLESVSFYGCFMETVEPGVFRNVPRLRSIALIYSHIKEIPRGVFNNLPALIQIRIHNNEVDIIEDKAFANIPTLTRLHAANNKLEYWNREWFENSTALEIMDFQYNLIRKIPRKAFQYLTNLSQIYFDHNEISEIQPGAFEGIRRLRYLGLRYNRLKEIDASEFPNELSIESLLIDANRLNFLPNEVLSKISARDITMDGNPWKCPCLDRILFWAHQHKATVRNSHYCLGNSIPMCIFPLVYSQTCLEVVDEEVTQTYMQQNAFVSTDKENIIVVNFKQQ